MPWVRRETKWGGWSQTWEDEPPAEPESEIVPEPEPVEETPALEPEPEPEPVAEEEEAEIMPEPKKEEFSKDEIALIERYRAEKTERAAKEAADALAAANKPRIQLEDIKPGMKPEAFNAAMSEIRGALADFAK